MLAVGGSCSNNLVQSINSTVLLGLAFFTKERKKSAACCEKG